MTALGAMQAVSRLRPGVVPEDAAIFLTSLIQGLAIRWSLGARDVPLAEEGLRRGDIQLALLSTGGPLD